VIRRPAAILALLTGLNLLNYLDRYVLSAVLEPLSRELALTKFVGGLLPTIFLVGYFATSPAFGAWSDRAGHGGRKKLIAVGIAVWSAATVASGLAVGKWSLIAARVFVGFGEASYATIAPTIIDDIAPPTLKGRWMSIFYAAIPLGSALGYLVGGAVLHMHGWRAAFFVAGGPGLALALLCLLIVEPERRHVGEHPDILGSVRTLTGLPTYRLAVLGFCAFTFALGGFGYWAPSYLDIRYHIESGAAAFQFGLITVVGGGLGTIVGGWLADRLGKSAGGDEMRTARANLDVCVISCVLGAPLAALAITADTGRMFYALTLPCEIALFLQSGPINVALLRTVPTHLRASAMALSIFAIHAIGDLWSPPLIGLVADHAPIQYAMYAGPLAFALAAFVWWRARASVRLT
jgi:MFS family permease